ncbi:MAG: efflux RND transporter permease subunit [Candidatus Cloacimonadota bacterium]|nr:efflux RND transporter permease subunit [Candidatus Cloacimonadota bacterium]
MILSNLSIRRPVMITMLILVFVVFGFFAYSSLPLNLMPVIDMPFVTIQTIYPGAGPQEIETQITKKIEDAVSTISKIDYVESYSMDNVSFVIIRFELGKDANIANQEAKDRVDAIVNQFPNDADKPSIAKYNPGEEPIMNLIFSGNQDLITLYEIADKRLKDRFAQIDGVAQVEISGGQKREIHVELDNKVVCQNVISLPQLSQIISLNNMNMPGGNFDEKKQEYSVRFEGEYTDLQNLRDLDIPTYFGVKKLHQLGKITDGGTEIRQRSTYFNNIDKIRNENLVRISIVKTSEGNPVEISHAVKKELSAIRKDIPAGSELVIVNDDSKFIESSVKDTLNNVILGILFTGIILLFFLHDLRSTLIVALAMPTSIISTFLLMQMAGFSLNILSLMGLSTSVGILVTNSVVVLENIFRHKRLGNLRREAAEKGTSEVTVAVIASTLTNIVVFLPLATMNTIAGQYLTEFALTVVFATIFSLVISFTLTPMLSSIILPDEQKKHPIGKKIEAMFDKWEHLYGRLLEKMFHKKRFSVLIIGVSFLLFFLTMIFVAPKLGFEFVPEMDEGKLKVKMELPQGTSLQETVKLCQQVEKIILNHKEVKNVLVNMGSLSSMDMGTNLGQIRIVLVDANKRKLTSHQVENLLIEELATVPNAKFQVAATSSGGGGGMADIEFNIMGQELNEIVLLKDKVLAKIKNIKGLTNLEVDYKAGKPQLSLIPKRQKISDAGTSVYEIALTMRAAIEGIQASVYREKGNGYDIKISLTDESVDSPEKIGNIAIATKTGMYRLSQLADLEYTKATNKINRKNKFTTIKFTGGVGTGFTQSNVINQIREATKNIDMPEGYMINWGGMSEMMEENNIAMGKAFMLAIMLTYMLLAAILESFTKPILILMTLPLAMIGVILALYFAGQSLNLVSMMAIIMLIGIVVNAAILLMDYTQKLREQGKNTKTALIEACPTKLKPIVMSSAAIMLGMLPMAIGIGSSGAEMRQPLGIVSIGGLLISTILTLLVIPAFYYLTTKSKIK